MATVIIMPKVGITVESCILTKWLKKKGDTVKEGETLFSYETDKASVDEEAKASGTLLAVFAEEGDDVPVMQPVCIVGEPGEDISALLPQAGEPAPAAAEEAPAAAPAATQTAAEPQAVIAQPAADGAKLKVSPRAKNLAARSGADLRMAAPTGPEGRIIERDVRSLIDQGLTYTMAAKDQAGNAAGAVGTGIGGRVTVADLSAPVAPAQAPAQAPEFVAEKLTNIRKVIAKSMVASLSGMAQLTLNTSFDATELLALRASFKANGTAMGLEGVTINDMLLFAVSRVLKDHRGLNTNLVDDTMYYYSNVNLGVAVDTDRGLMVPTLFKADTLSLGELSKQAKALIGDCKKGSVNPDLLHGGTFTVTNLGSLGVESFTPVINPPQTGILGVDTITQKVRETENGLKTYPSMGLSLTFDHRALDGAPAAKFLSQLKNSLEHFTLLLAL